MQPAELNTWHVPKLMITSRVSCVHDHAFTAGGSRNQGAAILVKVKALCEAEAEHAVHAAALAEAQAAFKAAQPAAAQHSR